MVLQLAFLSSVASVISPGSKICIVGAGPTCVCAAKLAAIRGYDTTALMFPAECSTAPGLVYDVKTITGSIPLKFMPIAGPDADEAAIEALAAEVEGVILAIDDEKTFGEPVIETFIKPGTALKRVSVMSRYLNGEGMGFFAKSAKMAANTEVWAGGADAVAKYKEMEKVVREKSKEAGVDFTIIRAGTLKGGASGTSVDDENGGGEPTLLNKEFYKLGVQDVANWRLIYDCDNLGVNLVAGDTLPGPGNSAVFTATAKCGPGDSHRGAVAASLVEALRSEPAANRDFSVGAEEGRKFPTEEEWATKFTKAAGGA